MARPTAGPTVANFIISTSLEKAPAHKVLGSSDPHTTDHRESTDTYAGELLRAGQWRIAVCQHGLQWLLQRRRPSKAGVGGAWDNVSYCQTCAALMRLWRARTGQDGAALLALLPEHVRAVAPEWRKLSATGAKKVGHIEGEQP